MPPFFLASFYSLTGQLNLHFLRQLGTMGVSVSNERGGLWALSA